MDQFIQKQQQTVIANYRQTKKLNEIAVPQVDRHAEIVRKDFPDEPQVGTKESSEILIKSSSEFNKV